MARPCNSVDGDAEEHYRRLERLLTELYLVLRALLSQGAPLLPPPPPPSQPPQPPPSSGGRRRRRRSGSSRCAERPEPPAPRPDQDPNGGGPSCTPAPGPKESAWAAIGLDLKGIADNLHPDFEKCSPNLPGLFEMLSSIFSGVLCNLAGSKSPQSNQIRDRRKT